MIEHVSGNKALYGWKWMLNDKGERDHLVLDEDQAAVLRQAGQEYADGVTYAKFSSGWKPKVYPGRAAWRVRAARSATRAHRGEARDSCT